MEEKKEYLNEEKFQRTKKKISFISLFIFIVGIGIGGYLIYSGVVKPNNSKVNELETKLEEKRTEIENKGITYNSFTKYTDGEAYELKIITEALDPSFDHCAFNEYKNNSITKEYCSLKNSVSDFNSTGKIMLGAFICIATCMISGTIYMISKQREILAYQTQQVMPVAAEGLDKMAPIVGRAGAKVAKQMAPVYKEVVKDIAPVYGEVAKEISKGIKEGLKDNKDE